MRIVTLAENTSAESGISSEHGLSLYIETKEHKILFDMGQTELFYENAEKLGVDISGVDVAVLSHGHYDHGGGLKKFLEVNKIAPVYIRQGAFVPHYNGPDKYIGLDTALENDPRIVYTGDEHRIADGLFLCSCNGREKSHPTIPSGLYEKIGEDLIEDEFLHEQYLMIEEDGKRVLISGCSHRGVMNIMDWLSPDIFIGGFHFSKLPVDSALSDMARELLKHDTVYYTCHCTGREQYEFMKGIIKDLGYLSSGAELIL